MDAFVETYQMEDVENQATEKLLEMSQRTRLKLYKTKVYEQLVKIEMMTAATDAEAHKIKVKDQKYWIKVVLGGLQKIVDKKILKKFKNAVSVYDDVMSKFLKDEFTSLKSMFDEATKHESFLIKFAAESEHKCYWGKATSRRQQQNRKTAQAADSGEDAVCLVDAEQSKLR